MDMRHTCRLRLELIPVTFESEMELHESEHSKIIITSQIWIYCTGIFAI